MNMMGKWANYGEIRNLKGFWAPRNSSGACKCTHRGHIGGYLGGKTEDKPGKTEEKPRNTEEKPRKKLGNT